jgi:hypothetical protein
MPIYSRLSSFFVGLLLFASTSFAQINIGTYVGIDHATNYTNPTSGAACTDILAVNAALGDADFVNGTAEIPLGWSFSGTWNSGNTYVDGPGPEVLLVSLHTYTETWDVALLLSDGTTTPFQVFALTIVTSNASGSLQACSFFPGPYNYERPSQELDFATFPIPAGVGVIGIVFEPLTDGAANPDPHGVIILENTPILDPGCTINTVSTCFNTCLGMADVVDGPDAPYTYLWDAAAGNATTQSVSNLCPGSYQVIATGNTGTIDTLIAVIDEQPELIISEDFITSNVCFGETGQLVVSASGGTLPYNFSLNGGAFATSTSFDPLSGGNYTVVVQDANLCSDTLNTTITEGAEIVVSEVATDEICLGDCEGTITLSATGDGPFTYSIDNMVSSQTTGDYNSLCPGVYPIDIEDVNGCAYTSSLTINDGLDAEIPATVLFDTTICQGATVTIVAEDLNTLPTQYSWSNGAQGPSIEVSDAGVYVVTLSNLCQTSLDSVTIFTKLCDIIVPNIISLADGSQNPLWFVEAEGVSTFNLVIVNRWGQTVYECDDAAVNCLWDGRDLSGEFVSEGTYFYIIDAALEGGEPLQKHGFIQVVN